MDLDVLAFELFNAGCIKFGEFTLKSGIKSPIYFDFRTLVSHPKLLVYNLSINSIRVLKWWNKHYLLKDLASRIFCEKIKESALDSDLVCGVPFGAIPMATVRLFITVLWIYRLCNICDLKAISLRSEKPMIMRRKEAKSHGTKNLIEGNFKPNDRCLVIEDVITSGSSVIETVNVLTRLKSKYDLYN